LIQQFFTRTQRSPFRWRRKNRDHVLHDIGVIDLWIGIDLADLPNLEGNEVFV
jgi:hypothetical protein